MFCESEESSKRSSALCTAPPRGDGFEPDVRIGACALFGLNNVARNDIECESLQYNRGGGGEEGVVGGGSQAGECSGGGEEMRVWRCKGKEMHSRL